jgi:serine phosphatase RsbU (regulator of sigma subunit)
VPTSYALKILAAAAPSEQFAVWENLAQTLSGAGHQVEWLQPEQSADALKANLSNTTLDALLLDPHLSLRQSANEDTQLSALDFCNLLRHTPGAEHLPVILLGAGMVSIQDLYAALKVHATDYISCNADSAWIQARLAFVLTQQQALHQAQALSTQMSELNKELYERNLQVEKELYVARQLQQSLLPPFLPVDPREAELSPDALAALSIPRMSKCHVDTPNIRISGVYIPSDALGGDMYDVITFQDEAIGVAVVDVSGHGVPAGFITTIFKSSFYRATHHIHEPNEILAELNNELANIITTGEYLTGVYCRLNTTSHSLTYSGAGHPYPMWFQANSQQVARLEKNGMPLVWVPNMDYPQESIQLNPGDQVLLFTDGVTELKNWQDELFGEERLASVFATFAQSSTPFVLDTLIQELSDFSNGAPLSDDFSMVLVEIR